MILQNIVKCYLWLATEYRYLQKFFFSLNIKINNLNLFIIISISIYCLFLNYLFCIQER